LFAPVRAELIENVIVGATQIDSKNQNSRKIKNNKSKTKLEPHNFWYCLALQRNLCLKNAFKTVKSKIKNQNVKPQIKIQKVLFPN